MRLQIYKKEQVPESYRKQMQYLHRRTGLLYDYFAHRPHKTNRAVVLTDGDLVVGWGLFFVYSSGRPCFGLHIRRGYRKQGYGSRIMKKGYKIYKSWYSYYNSNKKLGIWGHDNISHKFFSKHEDQGMNLYDCG